MRIKLADDVNLHWWGKRILLVYHRSSYYILDEIETQLAQYLRFTTCIEEIVDTMARDVGTDQNTVAHFIGVFLENFRKFIYTVNDAASERIEISGEYDAFYPLEIHISMTDNCTQKCRHCYKRASTKGCFISYGYLSDFLRTMVGKVPYLNISGGEPTIHPNFCDLIYEFGDAFCMSVLSSGYKLNIHVLNAIKRAKDGLTVSVYSSDPEVHDAFAGTKGSYVSIMKTIDKCREMGIPVQVSTMLTEANYDDVETLTHQLSHRGVKHISVGTIAPVGRAADNRMADGSFLTDDIRKKVLRLNHDNSLSVAISGEATSESSSLSLFKCSSGTLSWSVYEDGEIHPCGLCRLPEFKMGNICDSEISVLKDRDGFESRIAQAESIRRMQEKNQNCPFFELKNS